MSLLTDFNDLTEDQQKKINDQVSQNGDPLILKINAGTLTAPEQDAVDDFITDYRSASQGEKDELVGPGHQARKAQL